ncbi:MAG TPA: carboxypeptidase-like regulatory domain-containing protein [Ilumatobacteraceae bacterium]|nr:carboxypeptidase-like regulatory domain-containing protein [Ilumatobacteraceae bacterium]
MNTTTASIRRRAATALATLTLAVGASAASASATAPAPTGIARTLSMSGRIVDASTQRGIAGLQVTVHSLDNDQKWTGTTDSRGYFLITNLKTEEFELYVQPTVAYCGGYLRTDVLNTYLAFDATLSSVSWNSLLAQDQGIIADFPHIGGHPC